MPPCGHRSAPQIHPTAGHPPLPHTRPDSPCHHQHQRPRYQHHHHHHHPHHHYHHHHCPRVCPLSPPPRPPPRPLPSHAALSPHPPAETFGGGKGGVLGSQHLNSTMGRVEWCVMVILFAGDDVWRCCGYEGRNTPLLPLLLQLRHALSRLLFLLPTPPVPNFSTDLTREAYIVHDIQLGKAPHSIKILSHSTTKHI